MAIPATWVLAAAAVGLVAFVMIYGCGRRNGRSDRWDRPEEKLLNESKQANPVISTDAFELKETKKQNLLEKARKRYLELHPEFTPPEKSKSQ
jgi:hypothetical protein